VVGNGWAEAKGGGRSIYCRAEIGRAQLYVTPSHACEIVSAPPRGAVRASTDDWARSPHDS